MGTLQAKGRSSQRMPSPRCCWGTVWRRRASRRGWTRALGCGGIGWWVARSCWCSTMRSIARQVRPLLPGTAGTLVLITSRRRLTALPEAIPVTLDVLPAAEAAGLFVGLVGPAWRLITQRPK